ncbi:hypothetical protein EYF80_026465 [Liparis tanakae]|uniref:Uncharacterized protein n=1 Tax=Liparis tanakae TaxID=230148 RepID=A0A4Z2HEE9_9TELE|nr:hypothetical protein EYF80_026465 [Liparis tanakae]
MQNGGEKKKTSWPTVGACGGRDSRTLLIAPFLEVVVVLLLLLLLLLLGLRLLLLAHLRYVVVGVGVSGGAVKGIVTAVVPGLAEHVVGYLQALVPGAGRFQERQRLPPALRHLSLSPMLFSSFLFLPRSPPFHYG